MTWVKICGITNLEDAQVAVDAGADAVGFVFYEKSPRCVTVKTAREICEKLPEGVEKVGVFAGDSLAKVVEIKADVGLDGVQVYPLTAPKQNAIQPSPEALLPAPKRIYFALPVEEFVSDDHGITVDATKRPDSTVVAIVLDSGAGRRPGGTGITFNWSKAAPAVARLNRTERVVIAGGLTSENVGEAMTILHPWGVDVASGVEARPGKKDPEKVRAFVRAVREHDRGSAAELLEAGSSPNLRFGEE